MNQKQKDKIKAMVFKNLDNLVATVKQASPSGIISWPVLDVAIRLSKFKEFTPGLELFQVRYNSMLDSLHIAMLSVNGVATMEVFDQSIQVIKDAFVKGMD